MFWNASRCCFHGCDQFTNSSNCILGVYILFYTGVYTFLYCYIIKVKKKKEMSIFHISIWNRKCLFILFPLFNQNVCFLLSCMSTFGEGNGIPLQYSCLENSMDRGAWEAAVHGVAEGRTRLSDFTFTSHFCALEKEMATHSSVLAWRIPGMGEPGGLPFMGSHRVGHD